MFLCFLSRSVYILLFALCFLTSCEGQVKTERKNGKEAKATLLTKISKPQGLNKDAMVCIGMQDNEGNIWFGSVGEGLYKFDGKHFTHFSTEQGLSSNILYSILQDKSGNIWVGTKKGLDRFDGQKFVSIPIVVNSSHSPYLISSSNNGTPSENAVWSLMQDRSGMIWIGTDEAVYCYNGNGFSRFLDNHFVNNKDGLKLKGIFSILEDKNGTIWFAECSDEGVSSYDGKKLSIVIPYKEIGRTDRIIEDNHNKLWFATAFKGIGLYDGKSYTKNVFKSKGLDGSYNILEDSKGNIWFDTQDGLGFYDGTMLQIFTEKNGMDIRDFMPVLLDKFGNVWFSSKGMKLYKYDGKAFMDFSE
jgi:ligand-binding sensor domain-containing protein